MDPEAIAKILLWTKSEVGLLECQCNSEEYIVVFPYVVGTYTCTPEAQSFPHPSQALQWHHRLWHEVTMRMPVS
eukprot:3958514-Amphidinium_carterae.4